MKQLILHIGRHKTGTTNLQFSLAQSAEQLMQAGACYPATGRDDPFDDRRRMAHHELATALARGDQSELEKLQRAFRAEVVDFDPVIISSEGFQNLDNLTGLRQFFEGFRIRVVCYLREYLAYIASAYAQEIQTSKMVADFPMFAEYNQFAFMQEAFIARWNDASDEVIWRLYDRSVLVEGDIVADFADAVQLPVSLPPVEDDTNRSISGNLIAFKLLVNMLGLHAWNHPHILGELASEHSRFSGRFYISREDQARYRSSNPCNAALQRMFGNVPLADFSRGNPIWGPGCLEDFTIVRERFAQEGCLDVASHPLLAACRRLAPAPM